MNAVVERGWWPRVRAGLTWRAFAAVVLLALLVSTQLLFQPHLFEMWELPDIAQAWGEYFGQVALIGVALLAAIVAVEQLTVPRPIAGAVLLAGALVLPPLLLVALFAWYYSGNWLPAAPWQPHWRGDGRARFVARKWPFMPRIDEAVGSSRVSVSTPASLQSSLPAVVMHQNAERHPQLPGLAVELSLRSATAWIGRAPVALDLQD